MRRIGIARGAMFILLFVALAFGNSIQQEQITTANAVLPLHTVIVVDAGHGGVDGGCVGNGVVEKEVTLPTAMKLATLLRISSGGIVKCTRTEDIALCEKTNGITWKSRWRADLQRRVEFAEEAGASALVSIHANKIGSSTWRGAQVFYQQGSEHSKLLAETIQARLKAVLKNTNREAKSADYYLLRKSTMPAVIVEVGFLSNPEEAQNLMQAMYQEKLAWAICQGALEYLGSMTRAR